MTLDHHLLVGPGKRVKHSIHLPCVGDGGLPGLDKGGGSQLRRLAIATTDLVDGG